MPVYSHSRLSCFEQCPLKFKYKYLDKLEAEEGQTIEAFLGSTVHRALEKLYLDYKFQKKTTLEELLSFFREEWEKKWVPDIVIVRKDFTKENYEDMGVHFLTDYFKRYHPFRQTKTIGLEMLINIDLNGDGKYKLQGYIDRLGCTGEGLFEIHDYKTTANLPAQDILQRDRQLALYAMAVRAMYPQAKRVELVWHFLAFDQEMRTERSEKELELLKAETAKVIDEIESAKEFPPKESRLCDWCEFGPVCPRKKHLFAVEALPPEQFLAEDGVRLANEFIILKEKKDAIEREVEAKKDELFRYAEKKNVENITGSEVTVQLRKYPNIQFSTKTDIERSEVELIIKKAGIWPEYSQLNLFKLGGAMRAGRLDSDIIRKIKPYAKYVERKVVYTRKNNEFE